MIDQETINKLDSLQSRQNDGRGVSCIKSVVAYLRMNDWKSAKTVYFNERDKVWQYPELKRFLDKMFNK